MKRIIILTLILIMTFSLCCACGKTDENINTTPNVDVNATPSAEQDNSGGSLVMEDDTDNSDNYEEVCEMFAMTGIGKPVEYTLEDTIASDENETMRGFRFAPNSGEVTQTDIDGYATAIWNLCVRSADKSTLYCKDGGEYVGLSIISDAKSEKSGVYTWYYYLNDTLVKVKIAADNDLLVLEFAKENQSIS